MSLKDIFGSTDSERNYLSEDTQQETFAEVESARNASAVQTDQQAFVPSLDYHNPNTFSRFGSAYYYYKGAIERVLDYYPYDGSDAEINEFHNRSLDIEKFIFNNLYPRTTGYVKLAVDGWGTLVGSKVDGYGVSDTPEYITFYGGPGTGSVASGSALSLFSINTDNNKPHQANIYDESIYRTAGLPLDYGSGSRESNLKSDFDTGVTLEFWLTTGSANTVTTAKTEKQVVVDIWNSNLSSSHDYGRITLALNGDPGSGSPILLTAQSGTTGIFEQTIGTSALTTNTLAAWHHYAVVLYNSGSDLISQLYVDGTLNQQTTHASAKLGALAPKDLQGRLGSLLTAPSGTAETAVIEPSAMATSGKLTGSMDEFRFWKARRTGKEIGEHWFSQVRGGTNTDISNTTLGIYYKFNEGVTLTSSIDSVVLDYSGRISNGVWTGYGANSRNSGSAILSASAASKEYEDPIVRSSNPSVVTLKTSLLEKGNYHDANNNAAFMNYVPSWVIEEHEENGNENLKVISHIAGAYFDKLHAMAGALPQVKTANYPSASYKPIPFAEHLPQSLGLYTPELFVDATVLEKFSNRDKDSLFEGDLTETKNLIYTNLYNNLTNIYKAKGTEKALRNVLRCFHIDERLIKVNVYANNQTFQLQNNVEQVITNKKVLNFNKKENRAGVVYQAASGSESRGYISGTYGAWTLAGTPPEALYGMTLESDIILPRYYSTPNAEFDRKYTTVSLFGMATAQTASAAGLSGENPTCLIPGNPDFDVANLQVFAIKEANTSKNVYFKLTSSYGPGDAFPELTSSVFFDAYDDTQWNLSVRIKPSMYPLAGYSAGGTAYTYDVIFHGTNVIYGDVKNSFTVTGSMTKAAGTSFLEAAKRVYAGAQRTNLTGALVAYSDAYLSSLRYWTKYVDDNSLAQHARDLDNFGISGSYQNISPFNGDLINAKLDILNLNTLALNWNFGLLTGSSTVGGFSVQDYSSGSTLLQDNYGWVGAIGGYQLPGSGSNFETSATDTAKSKTINAFRFIEPERATSADAVQILSEDDKVFGVVETVPSYVYTVEKSMHRAISEEMLDFFAGVVDFNNVIGETVNRYRGRYKSLEKLREIFFRRVTSVSDVEKFIDYYKWFDDALALIMGQLMPASSEFTADVYNTIESHVLERNKYQSQYPTLETKSPDLEAAIQSIVELAYDYNQGRSPLPGSPRPTNNQILFWKERALRTSPELSSSNAAVNTQREIYRKVVYSNPTLPTKNPSLNSPTAGQYASDLYANRTFAKTYILDGFVSASAFHGGINFGQRKQSELTHNSLYPFGPINTSSNRFIPLNVLLALQSDIVPITDFINTPELRKKRKRYFKVLSGRNYENGLGYYNMKSDMIFPFNLMSSSVITGYNKVINDRVSGGIELTNLHHDTYGSDMETPMQGPFTEYAVGGHQSRHVALNYSSSTHALDTYLTRPEAWKILVGECADQGSGALGMAEVNYPYPDVGRAPITASGVIKVSTQPAIGDSVTIGDGDSSLTFAVPFENEKAILFDGSGGSDNVVIVGGNISSSLTNTTGLVSPIYCKDTDATNLGCTGTPDFYERPTQTWAAWISQSQDDAGYIFQTGQPHAQVTFWTRTNNRLRFNQLWYDGDADATVSTYWETANDAFASGEWQHVAVVFDASLTGSTSASVYVNGTEVGWDDYPGSGTTALPTSAGSRLNVARFADGTWGTPGVTSGYNCSSSVEGADVPCNSMRVATTIGGYSNAGVAFTGSIDEMNVWNVSMSAEQINELYATGSALNLFRHSLYLADDDNLHSWWRMGDNAYDAVDGSDTYSAANRIRDVAKAGSVYGFPRKSVTGFTDEVVTGSSGGGSDVTWTKGASYVVSALNLYTAITGQYASGNLNISASLPVGSGDLEVMNLSNTKYGTTTSTKRNAQGNLGNVDIYQTGSLNTWDGMTGGEGPKIMNYNAPRATYYRGMVAKSPVNIRNIQLKTGSTILGNYQNNYEIVQTVGAFENPRSFIETQPTLPSAITTRGNLTSSDVNSSIVVFNYTSLNENNVWGSPDHYKYNLDYLVTNNSGAFENNSIIVSRFGAPGSRETTAHGFQDFRSSEFSPYNTLGYRNLSVMKPSQGPSGSEAETTGIRVFDIHGQDYGLYSHRARHAARFGRDSLQVTGTTAATNGPGASYDQLPAMFKVQRNTLKRLKLTSWEADTYTTGSRYDNSNVTHPIPQSDRQYSWITSSVVNENDLYGYLPANFILSTSAGYIDAYDFVSSSNLVAAIAKLGNAQVWGVDRSDINASFTFTPVDFAGLNTLVYEPLTASSNLLGYPALSYTAVDDNYGNLNIINSTYLTGAAGAANYDLTTNFFDGVTYASSGSLQGWWRLDEDVSSAGNVVDSSGKDRYGDFASASRRPAYTTDQFPTPYIQTASCDFDGSTDKVRIDNNVTWDHVIGNDTGNGSTQQMTLAAWVNLDAAESSFSRIIDFGGDIVLDTNGTDKYIRFYTYWNTDQVTWTTSNDAIADSKWYHIVLTYDASSASNNPKLYINGVNTSLTEGGTTPTGAWIGVDGNSVIGGNSYPWDGKLADVAVWNSILTDGEIEAVYKAGAGVQGANTVFPLGVGGSLNALLLHRNGGYGFPSWKQVRNDYHPIVRNEKDNNRISVITSSGEVAQYDLFPVSTRGRPISLNVTQQAGADFTVKSTYNNESIFFTQRQLNDLVGVTNQDVVTPYNQIVDITTTSPNYNLNWVLYSQNLFPSVRNEYQSYARERKDYENLFWRDNLEERYTYGSPRRLCYASGDFVRCNYSAVVTVADFSPSQFDTPNQYNQNSLGIPYIGPQYYRVESGGDEQYDNYTSDTFAASALSQSSWPLDPPKNFLSRTTTRLVNQYLQLNPYYGGFNSYENTWDSVNDHRVSGAAGELQNTYVMPLYAFLGAQTGSPVNQNYDNVRNTNRRRLAQASPGALYARKHLISSPGSVTSPSGPSAYALYLNAFGVDWIFNQRPRAFQPESAAYKGQVWIGGGEALWEAGPNAGIFVTSGSASVWQSYPSEPWFNDYDDYKFDLMNVAKDYVIVPEYRMSEHVLDYAKNGVLNPNKHDTFEIVGARLSSSGEARVMPRRNPIGSAQAGFYKDYSNSEFLKDVLKVKQDTLLNAKEIRLVCSAAIRYRPQKGFYPAQRTLDLVSQFSRSYGDSLKATNLLNDADTGFAPNYSVIPGGSAGANWGLYNYGGQNRPALAALFAPGILFNSIKAGIACDYPVVSHGSKVGFTYVSGSTLDGSIMEDTSENWLVNVNTGSLITSTTEVSGYSDQDGFFDARFPFETIIRPEEFMMGVPIIDLEPHHLSASFQTTSSLIAGPSDNVYTMMAQNFFGEVGNFFLKDSGFTKLESKPVPGKLTFESGSVYGARIRLRKSHNGRRFYTNESASWDVYQYGEVQTPWGPLPTYQNSTALNAETVGFKPEGALGFGPTGGNQASASVSSSGWFELPQDPANMLQFKETFTMYSRPTAFGPPLSGRPILNSSYGFMTGANSEKEFEVRYSPMDALNGFNWAYTPPYYHGEAWIDLVFWPSSSREYSPEEVLNESLMNARRFDPGNSVILRNSASLADFCSGCGHGGANLTYGAPYGGANINTNAMQLSASVNYLGIEKVQFTETDQFDNPESRRNVVAGTKWVIQPKFETPMANFSDMGTRPLTASNGTITFPLVASASTSRGMWHQFGILEPDPNKGIFLEIGDIPPNWLQNHYEPRASSSIYNNYNTNTSEIRSTGASLYKEMRSLADLFGFEKENTSARLGELADSQTIREAIVAIPYLTNEIGDGLTNEALNNAAGTYRQSRKKLVSIPQERFEAAKKDQIGSLKGDSFIAAGSSIRKQLQKMQRYILPPEFDFLTNPSIDPFVMYMFEFEYTFDKDDLNYMWQNLAPRDYKKIDLQAQSVAHELMDTELLSERNLVGNDTLRWMVFKVKQRSTTKYQDLVAAQASQASNQRFLTDQERRPKPYQFNWPYDYLSLVEMIKMDVEVLFTDDEHAQLTKDEVTGEPGMTRKKMARRSKKKMGLTKGAKGFKAQQEEKKIIRKKAIKKQKERKKRKLSKSKSPGTTNTKKTTTKRTARSRPLRKTPRSGGGGYGKK